MDSFSKYLRNNFKEIDISSAIADYKGEFHMLRLEEGKQNRQKGWTISTLSYYSINRSCGEGWGTAIMMDTKQSLRCGGKFLKFYIVVDVM